MPSPSTDRYDVRPVLYFALSVLVFAHGRHRAIRPQAHGMIAIGADRLPVGDLLPEGETALARVGIVAKPAIHHGRRAQITFRLCGFRRPIVLGGDEYLRDVPRRDGGDGDEKHDDDDIALMHPLRALFFRRFQRLQFLCFRLTLLCALGTVLVGVQVLKRADKTYKCGSSFRLRLFPAKPLILLFPFRLRFLRFQRLHALLALLCAFGTVLVAPQRLEGVDEAMVSLFVFRLCLLPA